MAGYPATADCGRNCSLQSEQLNIVSETLIRVVAVQADWRAIGAKSGRTEHASDVHRMDSPCTPRRDIVRHGCVLTSAATLPHSNIEKYRMT